MHSFLEDDEIKAICKYSVYMIYFAGLKLDLQKTFLSDMISISTVFKAQSSKDVLFYYWFEMTAIMNIYLQEWFALMQYVRFYVLTEEIGISQELHNILSWA